MTARILALSSVALFIIGIDILCIARARHRAGYRMLARAFLIAGILGAVLAPAFR